MHVLFLTDDLMFASRVRGTANGLRLEIGFVPPARVETLAADPDCRLLLIDLQNAGANAARIISHAKSLCPQVRMIGFGPHVAADMLSSAKEAGCDEVWTRGEFQRDYVPLLTNVAEQCGLGTDAQP